MDLSRWIGEVLEKQSPRYDAKLLGEKMGFELAPTGASISGDYGGNFVLITLKPVGRRRRRYRVEFYITLKIPYNIELSAKERVALFNFLRPSVPIDKQTGYSMVTGRFVVKGKPEPFFSKLLSSLDFCYSLLLFPLPKLTLKEGQLHCTQWTTLLTYVADITFVLEKIHQFTSAFENIVLDELTGQEK